MTTLKKVETIRRVFFTVGTTEFDEMVNEIDRHGDEILSILQKLGCTYLGLQIGRGTYIPTFLPSKNSFYGIELEIFRYKPTIAEDMKSADMIITHCGAGSIIEALTLEKLFLVIINNTLQGNHQMELANALAEQNYCISAFPNQILSSLEEIYQKKLSDQLFVKIYPKANHDIFPKMVDDLFPSM